MCCILAIRACGISPWDMEIIRQFLLYLGFNLKLNCYWGPQIAQSSLFCKESQRKEIKRLVTPACQKAIALYVIQKL